MKRLLAAVVIFLLLPALVGTVFAAEPECICTQLCAEGAVDANCPVCSADGADLTACAGTAAAEPACNCANWCATGAADANCPVCSGEGSDLTGCTGALPAVTIEYADGTRAAWNGQTALDIVKDCIITVNSSFSMTKWVDIAAGVRAELNSDGQYMVEAREYTDVPPFRIHAGASLLVRNLTLIRQADSSGKNPTFTVNGYAEMINCNITEHSTNMFKVNEGGTLVISGGTYYSTREGAPLIGSTGTTVIWGGTFTHTVTNVLRNWGTATIHNGSLTGQGSDRQTISNAGVLTVNDGSISASAHIGIYNETNTSVVYFKGGNVSGKDGIQLGTVYMSGGTVTASRYGVLGYDLELTGGTISGCEAGTGITKNAKSLKIGGDLVLDDNDTDIMLSTGKVFTVYDSFADTATVRTADAIPDNTIRQITTNDTNPEKLAQFTSADGYSVGFEEDYLFLYNHVHDWTYTAEGNTVTAICTITAVPPCQYHEEGITLVLTAEDANYTGYPYNNATIANAITELTGAEPGEIIYRDETGQIIDAPVEVGNYSAEVEIGGVVAKDPFAICQTYQVTYVADGVTVDTQTIRHGGNAVAPEIPTKTGYDKTAPVWNHDGKNITGNLTIEAVYTVNTYTVTYLADGKEVNTQTVEHGANAVAPQIPGKTGYDQKAPDWNHDGTNITGDLTIEAIYAINTYTVTYLADGKEVDTQTVEHGANAVAPQIPGKTGYDQTAPQWDHDGKNITGDLTVNAVYSPNVYIVTYIADGKVVKTVEVIYGQDADAPNVPKKDGATGFWNIEATEVTADLTVTAVYVPIPEIPVTGDSFPMGLLVSLAVVSLAGAAVLCTAKRRSRN